MNYYRSTARAAGLRLATAMAALFVTSCASTRPEAVVQTPPEIVVDKLAATNPGKAMLVFYRKGQFQGSMLNTSVYIDGKEIADLDNGSYIIAAVAPGSHRLGGDEELDQFSTTFETGKHYYYRIDLQTGFWKGHGVLIPMEGESGRSQFWVWLEKGNIKPAKDVRDRTIVVSAPPEKS